MLVDPGLQLISRCFDIWVGSHTKKIHTAKPAHDEKSFQPLPTLTFPSHKNPTTPTFQRRFPSRNTGQPDNPLGVVPNLRSILYERSKWKEKVLARIFSDFCENWMFDKQERKLAGCER